jgi:hypothetical protein
MTGRWSRAGWWALLLVLTAAVTVGAVVRTGPLLRGTAVGSREWHVTPPDTGPLPGRAVPVLDSPHIPVGDATSVRYDSVPPTSGPHFAVVPAPGVYRSPLPEGLQVHALEHGHTGIQYAADVAPRVVRELEALSRRFPSQVFVAPYPKLSHGIALTAWGRIDTMDRFDRTRVIGFVHALSGRYDHGWTHRR